MCNLYARVVEMSSKRPRVPLSHHVITIKMPVWNEVISEQSRAEIGGTVKKEVQIHVSSWNQSYFKLTLPLDCSVFELCCPAVLLFLSWLYVTFNQSVLINMWWSSGNQVYEVSGHSAVTKGQGESIWKFDLMIFSRSWCSMSYVTDFNQIVCSYHWLTFFPLKFCQIVLFLHNFFKSITSDFSYSRLQAMWLCTGPNIQV